MSFQERYDEIIDCIEYYVSIGEQKIPEALARETGLNLRLLGDAFQFVTDMTLIKYIRQRRLIRALKNKLENNLSVEDIAADTPFCDAAAFTKACKNEFNLTPSQITEDVLVQYPPLHFVGIISGYNADQTENDKLTVLDNVNQGISSKQFADVKRVLEIGAIYGFDDEDAEYVYRLAMDFNMTIEDAADYCEWSRVEDKYDVFSNEMQQVFSEIRGNGYKHLHELPRSFFDVYFSEENDKHGWFVPYICEIAEALDENGMCADDLSDIVMHADTYGVDIVEAIENFEEYEKNWNDMLYDAMENGIPEEDRNGFGHRSIWELDEGQESLLDVADVSEDDAPLMDDTFDNEDDDSEALLIARKYQISLRDAQELKRDLESHGYYTIDDLPHGFFQVYFHYDMDQFVGWDIPYVCEIVAAMDQNHIPMDQLDEVMYLASEHNTDPVEIIEQFEHYLDSDDEE